MTRTGADHVNGEPAVEVDVGVGAGEADGVGVGVGATTLGVALGGNEDRAWGVAELPHAAMSSAAPRTATLM